MIRSGAFLLLSLALLAQPPASLNTAPPPPATGTGVIEGRVTDSGTGSPVANNPVAMFGQAVRVVRTGPAGDFRIENLPAGTYMLSTEQRGVMGSARIKTIQLSEGERKSGVVLSLDPPAIIRGEITDETGDPVAGCFVQALRRQLSGGPGFQAFGGATQPSDDRGRYEIVGLQPGRYYLTIRCSENFARWAYSEERMRVMTTGLVFPVTRYPAEPTAAGLTIKAGETIDHLNFTLTPAAAVTVRIAAPLAGGQRLEGSVTGVDEAVVIPNNALANFTILPTTVQPMALYPMLPKGNYVVNAIIRDAQNLIAGYARQTFAVDGEHAMTVVIQPQLPPRLEGSIDWLGDPPKRTGEGPYPSGGRRPVSIVGAGGGSVPLTPVPQSPIQVMLLPVSESTYGTFSGPGQQPARPVDESNRFQYDTVLPGRYRVAVIGSPGYVKSINVGGQTTAGDTFEVGAGSGAPILVAVSTKMATLEVSVEGREAETNYVMVLSPADPNEGRSRQVSSIPALGGATITAPPGEYRVAVIPAGDINMFFQAEAGDGGTGLGKAVRLIEGAKVGVTVEPEKGKP